MALPSAVGRPGSSRLLRMRLGVRGNLFGAFAVIAGMAVVLSISASLLLGQLGEMMVDLSGQDIPRLAVSLQLASQSASLASQGPALLASSSDEELHEGSKKMQETQEIVVEKLGEIIELGADKDVISALSQTVKNIEDTIKDLGAAAGQRLDTSAQHEKKYDVLRKAQANFIAIANPAMMDAQGRMIAILGGPPTSRGTTQRKQQGQLSNSAASS